MTEQQWLTSTNLKSLTDYLVREKVTSRRKSWLFAVACGRLVEHLLTHDASRRALAAAERFAEGLIKESTLVGYCGKAFAPQTLAMQAGNPVGAHAALSIQQASSRYLNCCLQAAPRRVAETLALEAGHAEETPAFQAAFRQQLTTMLALLRDVVGNPFQPRPTGDAAWLEANGGLAGRLANSIYEERRFLELPILADALEDAGCTDAALLEHLRGSGPHARGCWALDLLLARE